MYIVYVCATCYFGPPYGHTHTHTYTHRAVTDTLA
jgi:hypothetical protein